MADNEDIQWMRRALDLAIKGRGRVEPNPMVGAVIVRDGRLLGEGFHERFGGPHGEIRAMEAAGGECRGATLYVTLSPCTGVNKKTPPCCDAVLRAGFRRVVIGLADPTQTSAVERLQSAGLEVTMGVLEPECRRIVAPFLKLRTRGMPWVIAKWAMTADGRIATATGDSKWISSEESRQRVHQWRNEVNAIMVGIGTVRHDDPLLTSRVPGGRNPLRVVLDAQASLPLSSQLVRSIKDAPLLVACGPSAPEENCRRLVGAGCRILRLSEAAGEIDVGKLLKLLGAESITNIMVEGGSRLFGYLFDRGLIDEVRIFIAPRLFGGAAAPGPIGGKGISVASESLALLNPQWTQVGWDCLLTGDLRAGIGEQEGGLTP